MMSLLVVDLHAQLMPIHSPGQLTWSDLHWSPSHGAFDMLHALYRHDEISLMVSQTSCAALRLQSGTTLS